MNEHRCNERLVAELRMRKFFVMKHADQFTKGTPDLSATKGGKTAWLEGKYYQTKGSVPSDFRWGLVIKDRDRVQLETMVELGKKGIAFYVLYLACPDLQLWLVHPNVVQRSVLTDKPELLGAPTSFSKILDWMI